MLQKKGKATFDWVLFRVTANFYLISILAALLVGMGQRSTAIPSLVFTCVVIALIATDWLGWLKIHPYIGYVGMILGATIAIIEFWNGRQIEQLFAVANLLVYVQLPLMFQQKHHRLFEHWGIFLMLELVVSSLLNQNVLFGVLLIPILIVGCSAMASLAVFVSKEAAGTSSPETGGLMGMFLKMAGQYTTKRQVTGIKMAESVDQREQTDLFRGFGWIKSVPIGASVVIFALVYFFALPRLHTGAYEGLGFSKPLVGFSGSISLDDFGELMSNNDIALRLMMTDVYSKQPHQPFEPPYIRGTVVQAYDGKGHWHSLDQGDIWDRRSIRDLPLKRELRDDFVKRFEPIRITVQEQVNLGQTQFSIPPFFRDSDSSNLTFIARDWRLFDRSEKSQAKNFKRRYSYDTYSFFQTRQLPYLIDFRDCVDMDRTTVGRPEQLMRGMLTNYRPERFEGLVQLRDKILSTKPSANKLEQALLLEDYLANSLDFTYSLLPSVNRESPLDPIEDFAANHRTGHCQFFASTLAIMLRTLDIPSRIVVGFRPSEYNDVGKFFVVRQNHAHAWVEALLPVQDFKDSPFGMPTWVERDVWLRLDPTPAVEGSNAGGSLRSSTTQTLDVVQQLWKDLVMDMDQGRQPEAFSIFNAAGGGGITQFVRAIEGLVLRLQTRSLDDEGLTLSRRFSFNGALSAVLVFVVLIVLIQVLRRTTWFPSFQFWSLWKRDSLYGKSSRSILFYKRAAKALERMGIKRKANETAKEYAETAQRWLVQAGFYNDQTSDEGLNRLVDGFYRLRYGELVQLQPAEMEQISTTVKRLEEFSTQQRKRSK